MKKLVCTAFACSLMLCGLVGCGKDDDSKGASGNGFEGKWACTEMISDGTSMKTMPLFDIPLNALFHIEIKDNGTYEVSSGIVGGDDEEKEGASDTAEGKWEKVDDDTIKFIKPEGATESNDSGSDLADADLFEEAEFDFKDGKLVVSTEQEGKTLEIVFERVGEFATYDLSNLEFSMSASVDGELNGDGKLSIDGDISFDSDSDDVSE